MKVFSYITKCLNVLLLASVFLFGCGGNGSSSNAVTPSERPSSVISGVSSVGNGVVQVYTFTGKKGDLIASGESNASGQYSLSVKHPDTPILVCVSGGSYYEPASATLVSADNHELCAVSEYVSGKQLNTTLSFYTHLGYALATFLTGEGESAVQAVTDANQRINSLLGFSATGTIPSDISLSNSPATSINDGEKYGIALAAISQYTLSVSQLNNVSLHGLYNSLSFSAMAFDDLSNDGILDGNGAAGVLSMGILIVNADTYRHSLAASMYDAVNASYNLSGLKAADIKITADKLNQSTDTIYGGVAPVVFDTPPIITMNTAPSSQYKGTVNFSFSITSSYGLSNVSVTVDGVDNPATHTSNDYTTSVDTTALADGDYTLQITATDVYDATQTYQQTLHIINAIPTTYSGTAYDGAILQGNLAIYDFAAGMKGAELASTTTDLSGHYSVDLLASPGPILLELTGGQYTEEASGTSVQLDTTQNQILRAVVIHTPGSTMVINVTTWTNVAEGLAEYQIASGIDVATAIANANSSISDFLGINALTVEPLDITDSNNAGPLNDGLKYGFMSGALSQWTYNQSVIIEPSALHKTINSINFSMLAFKDIKADGYLDGKGDGGAQLSFGGQSIDANVYRHSIALAMMQMVYNSRNASGLKSSDTVAYAKSINDSTNLVFNNKTPVNFDESGPTASQFSQSDISGNFTVSAHVSDMLGLVSTEVLLNNTSLGMAADPYNPSITFDSTAYNDCKCDLVIRSTSIDGTVKDTTFPIQIDNVRFLYLQYADGATNTYRLASYEYNISSGVMSLTDDGSSSSIYFDAVDPSGKYVYSNGSTVYNSDSKTGKLITPATTAFDFYSSLSFDTTAFATFNGSVFFYTILQSTTSNSMIINPYLIDQTGLLKAPGNQMSIDTGTSNVYYHMWIDQVNHIAHIGANGGIQGYNISPTTGEFTFINNSLVSMPNGLTDIVGSNKGDFTYILTLDTVDTYSNNSDNTLTYKFSVSTISGAAPWKEALDRTGKHLYVLSSGTNPADNTIRDNYVSVYDVDQTNGSLSEAAGSPYYLDALTAEYSYLFEIDAGSDYIFVYGSSSFLQIPINKPDGSLGKPVSLSPPGSGSAIKRQGCYVTSGASNAL